MAFFNKILEGLSKTKKNISNQLTGMFDSFTGANDEFFDELEELLILADVGVEVSTDVTEQLRETVKQNGLRGSEEIRQALANILEEVIDRPDQKLKTSTKPSIILVIGVNGVGKTTTIGKLAMKFTGDGKKVLLAAGDTFRAAAAEQLTIWSERANADIVKHGEGSDPASVIFDSISAAKARGADIIICDTAGRLHNKQNLMNELAKINRIIDRELTDADKEVLLVIDATTGQNGLIQAKEFKKATGLTGIVLTKLDGTAKGGIVFAVTKELDVPVKFIGVGEQADDLQEFQAHDFVKALLQ